ncbi:MAG: FAD-dependent oxidoreductase [Betaproteobacteria bacterium]
MVAVGSWGRLGIHDHRMQLLADRARVHGDISGQRQGLAYGMGRSYGDVCLNPGGTLWDLRSLDRFIAFDEQTGRLRCESGTLLREIHRFGVSRGWMLPVVPGTQYVTVGGAIANDVHGKNHHRYGCFGDHVTQLTLARTSGEVLSCLPGDAMFAATVGGLGLTGVIVEAELQLRRVPGPWLDVETLPYQDLQQFFTLADASEAHWEHTVSWIDCLNPSGRGIFMRANSVAADQLEPPSRADVRFPFVPPTSLVNRLSLRTFNAMYFHLKKTQPRSLQHYVQFFHPLDRIQDWNRMYGPHGFYQYQCVLPREAGATGIQAMLKTIRRAGMGSFLTVLKTFGQRDAVGILSFARPGVTLALDFPNAGAPTLALFERLDAIVLEAGGRLYPAKDARMPRALFEAGYPRLQEFLPLRDAGISSAMSRRLLGN